MIKNQSRTITSYVVCVLLSLVVGVAIGIKNDSKCRGMLPPNEANVCSAETGHEGDEELLDHVWDDCLIEGDPFDVVKIGEVCPLEWQNKFRHLSNRRSESHVMCFGSLAGFGCFNRFTIDVSTNDMKVLAFDIYSRAPVESDNVDKWLTNCVALCNRHFQRLEWGYLRDRFTGERDALCSRCTGDSHFDNLFIAAIPDVREVLEHPCGLVYKYDSPCWAILHIEIPGRYKCAFGEPSVNFAGKYLYRAVPVTSFE